MIRLFTVMVSDIYIYVFQGWKKERVLKEFWADGSRVISILPGDQRFMVKKVRTLYYHLSSLFLCQMNRCTVCSRSLL